jgi:hypothetical protein
MIGYERLEEVIRSTRLFVVESPRSDEVHGKSALIPISCDIDIRVAIPSGVGRT